jgi:hypothetical protein
MVQEMLNLEEGGLMPVERLHRYPVLVPGHADRSASARAFGIERPFIQRQTERALARIQSHTVLRMASVQAEGLVQTEKAREIDHLTRDAMSGQALLAKWRDTLAAGDPFVSDELRFFTDMARLGKGEIIANTIDAYCRESQGA